MSKQPIVCFFGIDDVDGKYEKKFSTMTTYFHSSDDNYKQILAEKKPGVVITIGEEWENFKVLNKQITNDYKKRWYHYKSIDDTSEYLIYNIWKNAIFNYEVDEKYPLVSVFSTSYKSEYRIQKPFRSLLNQTYKNWEWVIFDDTPSSHLNDKNWRALNDIAKTDHRIRIYKSNENSGLIGEVKYNSAQLCRGSLLVELDHDDDIYDEMLQVIVNAAKKYPKAGFFYTDCAEPFENGGWARYDKVWGLGYGAFYKQKYNGEWMTAEKTAYVNPTTLRSIVCAPNHIRVWRKSVYQEVGGHNYHLSVVDDYELYLRTFLKSQIVYIPKMLYLQYRNEGGNNFTFIRNAEIQKLVKLVRDFYDDDIHKKILELGFKDEQTKYSIPFWEQDYLYIEPILSTTYVDDNMITIVMSVDAITNLEASMDSLYNQTYKNWDLILIGNKSETLDKMMNSYIGKCDTRIRWWNLEDKYDDNGVTAKNYALRGFIRSPMITYMNEGEIWNEKHLQILIKSWSSEKEYLICEIDNKQYYLHSFDILRKYGYWKTDINELIERWESQSVN